MYACLAAALSITTRALHLCLSRQPRQSVRPDSKHPKAAGVCSTCVQALFSRPEFYKSLALGDEDRRICDPFVYKTTWKDVQQSKQSGCPWCRILDQNRTIEYAGEELFEVKVDFIWGRVHLEVGEHGSQRLDVHAETGNVAANYIKRREIVWQVGSDRCFEHAIESLRECTEAEAGHEDCRVPEIGVLPTRVIDCQDPAKPRLYVPVPGTRAFYATLSYVWGEDQPHKTTTMNLSSYTQGIDPSILPQTILDAITCTCKIGLRYLWVDAMCIVQDSKMDKRAEISRMRTIFRDSYVTIIAANSRKVSDGFLHDRDPPPPSVKLPFICPENDDVGTMLLREWQEGSSHATVNDRAWCLEELLLSRRIFIYAEHTLQFSCVSKGAENVGNGIKARSNSPITLQPMILHSSSERDGGQFRPDWAEQRRQRSIWRAAILEYTHRELTHPEDRLVALGGIAGEFQQFWPSSQYLAGLWQHQLLDDVLWYKSSIDVRPRPEKYRAPTWSWASVDGYVWAEGGHEPGYHYLCDVIRCETTLVDTENQFGQVSGGVLEMNAIMKEAWWNPLTATLSTIEADSREDVITRYDGDAPRDCEEEYTWKEGKVWAIPVRSGDDSIQGILVVPEAGRENVYRRVGRFKLSTSAPQPAHFEIQDWVDGMRVVVVIV